MIKVLDMITVDQMSVHSLLNINDNNINSNNNVTGTFF